MKSFICVASICLFCYCSPQHAYAQVMSQTTINTLPVNIPSPKTPEVATFEKFIQNPVSPHTGLHAIDIPIYTVQLRGIQVPIGLKYHSSGIKVNEIASEAGLGWALNAGGAISTNVNGIPDGINNDFNNNFQKIKAMSLVVFYPGGLISKAQGEMLEDPMDQFYSVDDDNDGDVDDDIDYLKHVIRGESDSEPDMFNLAAPGLSAQFFMDESGEWRTVPFQKLKIDVASGYFRVTDEAGTIYDFAVTASSGTTSYPASTGGQANMYPPHTTYSTYYLSRIITQVKDTLNYYYTGYGYTDHSEIKNRSTLDRYATADCKLFLPNERTETVFSDAAVGGQRLDSLIASNGDKVVFRYSSEARKDIDPDVYTRLEYVDVYKKVAGNYVRLKRFALSQSYVGPGPSNDPLGNRLMLNSAGEEGKPPYVFTYNQTQLPKRHDTAQDHWGYYNGKGGANLLPRDTRYNFDNGVDRDPDTQYALAGMLLSIKYPTGGTLDFEYEPHEYWADTLTYATTRDVEASVFLNSTADAVRTTEFTVTPDFRNINYLWTNGDDGTTMHNDRCTIEIFGPNGYYRLLMGTGPAEGDPEALELGTYTVKIENIGSLYYAEVGVRWTQTEYLTAQNTQLGTAGFRIKKIKNCAEGSPCIEQTYQYVLDDGSQSSGIPFQLPDYVRINDKNFIRYDEGTGNYVTVGCTVFNQMESSVLPLVNNSGAHIAYSQVSIITGSPTVSGKTVMKFLFDNSQNYSTGGFPYPPVITYDWLNGLTDEVTEYTYTGGQFRKVRKVKNHYLYDHILTRSDTLPHQYYTYGVKIALQFYPYVLQVDPIQSVLSNLSFAAAGYKFISSWHYLTSTEETQYDENGGEFQAITTYKRNNPDHAQVTEVTTSKSTGEIIGTRMYYPLDYPAGSNAVLASMQTRNMVNAVIEKTQTLKRNGTTTVTSSDLIVYQNNNNSIVPQKQMKLKVGTPLPIAAFDEYTGSTQDERYEEQIKYTAFNSRNSPVEYTDKTGIVKSVIWGYDEQLVVAEVTNASSQHIAFTSFESNDDGGWSVTNGRINNDGITGNRCLDLATRSMVKSGLSNSEKYTISMWVKSGASINISGGTVTGPITGRTNGPWTNKIYAVTGASSVTITGTGYIDEVRLHPAKAIMKTYAHKPGVGILSETDANSLISYYEYDNLNRLSLIRDGKGNIVKRYTYHYKEQ